MFLALANKPDVAVPASRFLFHAYRNALLATYSGTGREYDHLASLVELIRRLSAAIPAMAAITACPMPTLLDLHYDRKEVKLCGGLYPDWADYRSPSEQETFCC